MNELPLCSPWQPHALFEAAPCEKLSGRRSARQPRPETKLQQLMMTVPRSVLLN